MRKSLYDDNVFCYFLNYRMMNSVFRLSGKNKLDWLNELNQLIQLNELIQLYY